MTENVDFLFFIPFPLPVFIITIIILFKFYLKKLVALFTVYAYSSALQIKKGGGRCFVSLL